MLSIGITQFGFQFIQSGSLILLRFYLL